MQYQIDNFKVLANNEKNLIDIIKSKYKLKKFDYKIITRSIDARDKSNVYFVYRLMINTNEKLVGKNISKYVSKSVTLDYPQWKFENSPIIVGFGPAGIFASLYLARCNAKPIIIERGSPIEQRIKDVEEFLENKKLNINSNIQFGEGGAGAFSDGKLTCNVKNPLINFIFNEFYLHGANEDILYDSMPHIGTDVLRVVVKNIREEIIKLGGKFYFNTTFKDAYENNNSLIVKTENQEFVTSHLLLGIGHSAKDTIRHLYLNRKLRMEPKGFSMGVRVEHKADKISQSQYGQFYKYLPKAYYKLSEHFANRGVYTFCMCPGGYVMASQSEEKTIVTNGMSNQKREGTNSNSAILVDIKPSDFDYDILKGLNFQEKYERLAFEIGNDYRAPANLIKEFLSEEVASELRSIKTTYPHGLIFCNLRRCLPDFVVDNLKEGIKAFDKKLKGFADPDAILIGIESRSSSPVRILRDENRQSNCQYIYPMGEGAGYAGGITSASLDGLLTAMKITENK